MRELARSIGVMVALSFRADWRRSTVVFLLTPLAGLGGALFALWLRVIVDAAIAGDMGGAMGAVALLTATSLVVIAAALTGFTMSMKLQERTDLAVDQRLIELTAGIPTIEHHERPEYLDRLELLRTQRGVMSSVVRAIVQNASAILQVTATVVLLVTVHPALALLPLFAVPSLVIAGRTQRRVEEVEEATAQQTRRALHLFDLATDSGAGKELRVFRLEPEIQRRYRDTWTEVDEIRDAVRRRVVLLRGAGWLLFSAGYVAAIVLVVREAVAGRATPGQVLMALTLAAQVNNQVTGAAMSVVWLLNALKVVGRYRWLVDHARTVAAALVDGGDLAPVPERLQRGIELDRVAFRYPETDTEVLRDVSLTIPAGSTVAIVGENGAGKSTLVKLLCRFYEPTEGAIRVDGVDLRRIHPEAWRTRLSAGFQDFAKLELLAREAVGVGDVERGDDDGAVRLALERAQAGEVVDVLPQGLATQLGPSWDDGVDLSGGQWQKLALGRAMMRERPLLLVLDEPTAALDAEAEHALFERYAEAARTVGVETGAVTVLVSHRFSTVRMADLILVVDDGRVTEAGSHDDLVAAGGLYAELYELQARAYR